MRREAVGVERAHGDNSSPAPAHGFGVDLPQIFPLPLPRQLHHEKRSGAPADARSERAQRAKRRDVRSTFSSINWCAGYRASKAGSHPPLACGLRDSEASRIQAEVETRVSTAVDDFHDYNAIPTQQQAFRDLLRGRGVYDAEASGLSIATYTRVSCVSMPLTTRGAHNLVTLLLQRHSSICVGISSECSAATLSTSGWLSRTRSRLFGTGPCRAAGASMCGLFGPF